MNLHGVVLKYLSAGTYLPFLPLIYIHTYIRLLYISTNARARVCVCARADCTSLTVLFKKN
jgi:hypothetical protein